MRYHFSRIFAIIIMVLTGLASSPVSAITPQKQSAAMTIPDINFPETAKAEAEKRLKEAQANGDGPACALQTAVITYCDLSKMNAEGAPDALRRLETLKGQEKHNDIKALYAFMESMLLEQYASDYCKNRFDDANADSALVKPGVKRYDEIASWTYNDLKAAALKEYELALDLASDHLVEGHLPYPLSAYEGLICKGDEWGNRAIPTLYDFLMARASQSTMEKRGEQWLQYHAAEKDVLPTLIASLKLMRRDRCFTTPSEMSDKKQMEWLKEMYEKYKEHEEVGILLTINRPTRANYLCHQDYLERFPKSSAAESIRHDLDDLCSVVVLTSSEEIIPLNHKIEVKATVSNGNDIILTLLRIPDDEWQKHVNGKSWGSIPRSKLKAVEEQKCHIEHALPFWDETATVTFSPQAPGRYAVSAQYCDKAGRHRSFTGEEISTSRTMVVSDLEAFTIQTNDKQKKERNIIVVNRRTGAPVEGATVRMFNRKEKKNEGYSALTNSEGVTSPRDSFDLAYFHIEKGDDHYLDKFRYYELYENSPKTYEGNAFTNLAIYRPGETVRASFVVYSRTVTERHPVTGRSFYAYLYDANGKQVECKQVKPDEYGQMCADFAIPTDRMNGRWQVSLQKTDKDVKWDAICTQAFEVSEYKAPTFEVCLDSTETTQLQGKPAVVKGQVRTFTGMPVSGCQVKGSIKRSQFWWMYGSNAAATNHTFSTTTDANGCFVYECPAEWTDGEDDTNHGFWRTAYIYNVEVRCTDLAGETHQASTTFHVGKQRHIEVADADILIEKGKTTEVDLEFRSSDPAETSVQCHYMLIDSHDTTRVVKQGDFSSDRPSFDWNAVPSGTYIFKASINDDPGQAPSTAQLVLYRESDKTSPSDLPLWMPKASQKVDRKGNADILIGSAKEVHIYYTAESRNRLVKKGWINLKPGMHHFSLPMPAQADDYLKIQFISIYDNKHYEHEVRLDVPEKDVVHLAATTFRDHLVPGSHEKWTLRFTDSKGNPTQGRMLLGMYNHALHQLAPNDWHLNVGFFDSRMAQMQHGHSGQYTTYNTYTRVGHNYGRNNTFPFLNEKLFEDFDRVAFNVSLYDISDDIVVVGYGSVIKGARTSTPRRMMLKQMNTRAASTMAVGAAEAKEEAMSTDAAVPQMAARKQVSDNAGEEKGGEATLDAIEWRENDTKVALWMPVLNCDEEGNFQIEFDAPTDNTSWNLQALAWSKTMASDRFAAIVTTQRPVMVKTSAPRLLHSGDRAVLGASVMNATDKTQSATVVIETFDPRSRAVIASEKQQLTLAPKETKVITIRCEAKPEMPFIGLRVKAANAEGEGDGEQIMLPVVSDVEPVIETRPFYAHPNEKEIAIDASVKRAPNSENRLTLEYCNNPTWYVVTALPTLFNEDACTSVALIHNFFAISVAEHFAKNNEGARKAVSQWKKMRDDDPANPLVSNLAKNEDLKIGKLKASPWLNAAEQQTARMTELDKLFDAERNQKIYKQIIARLTEMQRSDGGFVWYNHKEAESSQWATSIVLEVLGELHQLGCISDQDTLCIMEKKAMKWLDNEMLKNEQRMKKSGSDKIDYMYFASYAYLRSFYMKRFPMGQDVSRLISKTLDACEKGWTESGQVHKAYLALILHRIGRHKAALPIVESIRQHALKDAKKGMYWKTANLSHGYDHPVALTSRLLQAFAEIDPRTEEIDAIRQWLLLEKQTSDWGGSSMAADAAYTLLRTGNDWLHSQEIGSFEITCNGKPVEVNTQDQYLGYVRMDLPGDASQIKVTRTGNNPAWGSLYHQYAAPMAEIKPAATGELSIEKELLVMTPEGQWKHVDLKASHKQGRKGSAQLKVGDRVQVRLTIRCTKALEYLTLNDQRPAFLEPKEQLSGYRWVNSTGFYQEIRDEATNLFFYRLSEGVYTIAYECDVTIPGSFSTGVASIQSQYAPQYNAHSAGMIVECE